MYVSSRDLQVLTMIEDRPSPCCRDIPRALQDMTPLPRRLTSCPKRSVPGGSRGSRHLEGHLPEPVDGEAHAIARRGELGGDAAPRHHDHVSTEHAAAAVEEVGQP